MDIINHLQALGQELCEIENTLEYGHEKALALNKAITAIDNLIEALEELNNQE